MIADTATWVGGGVFSAVVSVVLVWVLVREHLEESDSGERGPARSVASEAMRSFDHFVMTRFNLPHSPGMAAPDDAWLRGRLELFRRYTVPSVAGQTSPPTRWLVVCRDDSPEWFREELATSAGVYEPVWISGQLFPEVAGELVQQRRTGAEHVITTRIDNDDAISRDFCELVQGSLDGQDFEFVNLTVGAQWDGSHLYVMRYPKNAFISLIERAPDRPRTVWLDQHGYLDRYGPVREVEAHPAWVQVVHGANLGNRIEGFRVARSAVQPWFDVELPAPDLSAARMAVLRLADRGRWARRKARGVGRRLRRAS